MRIAINTKILPFCNSDYYNKCVSSFIYELVKQYSNDCFLIITDNTEISHYKQTTNCKLQVIPSKSKQILSLKIWYDVKLAFAIKKFNADVILHVDSRCILGIKTPQIICFPHLSFLHHKESISNVALLMYKMNQKKWIKKSKAIIIFSEFTKTTIINKYKLNSNKFYKINLVSAQQNVFINTQEKETILNTYSEGNEYFLFIDNFNTEYYTIQLLKAFTLFKKRLQSDMKLILIADSKWSNNQLKEKLKNYKYKSDVLLLENLTDENIEKIMASAYAYLNPKMLCNIALNEIKLMQLKVPIACSNTGCLPEILINNSALFFDTNNEKDIAEQMMMLYKDENLRNNLITNGIAIANEFKVHNSINNIMELLVNTTKEY